MLSQVSFAFTGDGMDAEVMRGATDAIKDCQGVGIPTVKPWNMQMIREKMDLVKASGALAVAMDVDAAGLPFLKNLCRLLAANRWKK